MQGEVHVDSASENSCCPYGAGYSGRTASSPREGHLVSVIREGLVRNVTGLKQARQGLGQAGWLVPQPEGPAADWLLENARYF